MIELKEKHCVPCEGGAIPLDANQISRLKKKLVFGWQIVENKKLLKKFPFANFKRGMAFAQDIAAIAESENHHPDLCIHFNRVEVELSTHAIDGLSENDFILAARIDEL